MSQYWELFGNKHSKRRPPSINQNTLYSHNAEGSVTEIARNENSDLYFWDDNQRLMAIMNSTGLHHNFYDHRGERVVKGLLTEEFVSVNGQSGSLSIKMHPITLYVNGYFVSQLEGEEERVSKHYYMGDQRVATNISAFWQYAEEPSDPSAQRPGSDNTALSSGYRKQLEGILRALGVSDSVEIIYHKRQGDGHTINEDTGLQTLVHPPHILFYYHPDYLGHVEYVTDGAGVPYQYFHYSPWGESLISQTRTPNSTGFSTPYRFNAKELDSESGLFYYGARYYHPVVSKWLGVDPMYHLYPAHTPYNYVMNNPVNLTDPNGMWVKGAGFFRNLFNSDEKILAQDEAAKHAGGEVIKIDGGWRASWSTANEGGNDDVDVNLDEIHMVDFKKGKDRPGTYKTLAHMIDSDFDAWQGRNMRSGLSTWNRIGERADKDVAPKIAETVALWMPPTAAINSIKTMSTGEDLFGDKKEGAWDRYIRPSVNLIPEAGRVLNMTNKFIRGLDYMDKGVNIIETKDVWKGKK